MHLRQFARHEPIRFTWNAALLPLVASLLLLPTKAFSANELTINFINKNPDYTSANIYVAFCGQPNPPNLVGLINGAGIKPGTSYSLAQLTNGITLTRFVGGRICVALGDKFKSPALSNDYNPNFNNPSLPDFNLRWDKAEITYDVNDPHSVVNLSATDFMSVPLEIQTYSKGTLVKTLTWHKPIAEIFHNAGLLCGFSPDAVCSDKKTGVATEGPTPGSVIYVVRVIAPSTVPAAAVEPYPPFRDYIDYVKANGITTTIEGTFQDTTKYKFIATVDSTGALVMMGTITNNLGPQSHQLIIASNDLDRGIYTCNPEVKIDDRSPTHVGNDAFGTTIRDVLAGFNLGFIASSEQNPNKPGATFGASPSFLWYTPHLPPKYAFAGAQPQRTFYNQYAAYLVNVTDAYGFPFTDLTQSPLAGLNSKEIDRMDITILPDK